MKEIKLTQNQVTIVDDEDYDTLSKYKWFAVWAECTKSFYAARTIRIASGKRTPQYIHREILGLSYGDKLQIDHINHNTLDNRRSNIQIVTNTKNHENRKNQSKYGVGIVFEVQQKNKPYRAWAKRNGKRYHIGLFKTPEEAIQARKEWLKMKGFQ